jgi:ABC-type transport system substrate-binding protein
MMYRRVWEFTMLCLTVSAVLLLGTAGAQAQTQASAGQAKVDRLVMGHLGLPYRDYMRPWIAGTPDHNIQHDPAFEWLFEVDPESGKYNPWLAESWEMAQDGRSWRIKLRKGVQFHHGYGEFTVQDVVHNHAL